MLRLVAAAGDSVAEGEVLLILEALKMEIEVREPRTGTVSVIQVSGGPRFEVGDAALIRFYTLHVIGLPLLAAIFMAVHFWRIRRDGGLARPL